MKLNKWQILACGDRIIKLERRMNMALGLSPEEDTLPERFLVEKETKYRGKAGKNTVVPIKKMVRDYYRFRGYSADGIPR